MSGQHDSSPTSGRLAARLSPEVVAFVLSVAVLILGWLIVRPGIPLGNGSPDASPSTGAPSAWIVVEQGLLSLAVSLPERA